MISGNPDILGQFIHPGLAWGGAGLASIPIIIHILNRRRFRKVPWAAMEFLLAAHRRSRRRLRLEQFLLLLIRCLIIVLLGLGLARPFLSVGALGGLGQVRRHHVLVIDNSLSAAVPGRDSETVFAHIRAQALTLVESWPVEDPIGVITAAQPATVVLEHGSYDRQLVRERIEGIAETFQGTDLAGALAAARNVLERSEIPATNHSVVLLSDNVRSAWLGSAQPERAEGAGSAARDLAEASALTILQSSPARRENVCIADFAAGAHLVGTLLPTPFRLRVVNASDRPLIGARAQILQEGRIVREVEVPPLDARSETTLEVRLQFSESGAQNLKAVLTGVEHDVLKADSERYLTLEVTQSARVLIVDGKPAASRFESQSGYLATALSPGSGGVGAGQIEPRVITEPELGSEVFGEYGVVVLCNVRQLGAETWGRLREYVAEGGALITFLGENVLTEEANRLGYAEGAGVLPCSIGGRALPGGTRESAYVLFSRKDLTHPVVSDFAEHATGSLFGARTWQYYQLGGSAMGATKEAAMRTVLRFGNGDAAIVERLVGRGTSLVVATTANMEWTNLPAKGDFVSLAWNLIQYAWPRVGTGRNVAVGERLRRSLEPGQVSAGNEFELPGGERVAANVVPDVEGFAAELAVTDRPGFYAHESAGRRTGFAANAAATECDLRAMGESELRELIGARFEYFADELPRVRTASSPAKRELGWHLLYLAYLLILLEPLLAMWFGHNR